MLYLLANYRSVFGPLRVFEYVTFRSGCALITAMLLVILLGAYWLYYNIAALVKHSGPVWESLLWIIFLGLLLYVCIDNLFFPNRHK